MFSRCACVYGAAATRSSVLLNYGSMHTWNGCIPHTPQRTSAIALVWIVAVACYDCTCCVLQAQDVVLDAARGDGRVEERLKRHGRGRARLSKGAGPRAGCSGTGTRVPVDHTVLVDAPATPLSLHVGGHMLASYMLLTHAVVHTGCVQQGRMM